MNILQVGMGAIKIPPQKYGGVELYIYSISRHMVRAGHDVTVLDINGSKGAPIIEYINGIKFIRLSVRKIRIPTCSFILGYITSRLNTLLFALKANSYIRKADFDVIHVSSTLVGLVLMLLNRKLRKKMVFTVHSPIWDMPSLGVMDRLALKVECYLMRRCSKVIVATHSLKGKIISFSKLKADHIKVIHPGVDLGEFGPNIDISDTQRKYGLEGRIVILFNGRIVPYKGVEYLIRAANIVVNDFGYKDVLFLLVGPLAEHELDKVAYGNYISRIFHLIKEANLEKNVKLTGAVPFGDLIKLFSACDIFVLPSLAETFGVVVSQAMASAKPVIGTKVGGIPDQIRDGWNWFLVEPANEWQLAEKIRYLIDSPEERARMGRNGRKFAEEEFGWSLVAEQLLQVYSEIG